MHVCSLFWQQMALSIRFTAIKEVQWNFVLAGFTFDAIGVVRRTATVVVLSLCSSSSTHAGIPARRLVRQW